MVTRQIRRERVLTPLTNIQRGKKNSSEENDKRDCRFDVLRREHKNLIIVRCSYGGVEEEARGEKRAEEEEEEEGEEGVGSIGSTGAGFYEWRPNGIEITRMSSRAI